MDGPIADFDLFFWKMCEFYGWTIDLDSLDDPKRKRFLTDNMPHISQAKAARSAVNNDHRWFAELPVVEGAKEGVRELEQFFDVWLCTKPLEANKGCRDGKGEWVEKHFPSLGDKLIITPNKAMIRGDVLLDDAIKPEWLDTAVWAPVVYDEPFNREGSTWEGWYRWSWSDPIEKLMEYACL